MYSPAILIGTPAGRLHYTAWVFLGVPNSLASECMLQFIYWHLCIAIVCLVQLDTSQRSYS